MASGEPVLRARWGAAAAALLLALLAGPLLSLMATGAGPVVVIRRTDDVDIKEDTFHAVAINLTSNQSVYYRVEVLSGSDIDVFVMSWPNFESYRKDPAKANIVYSSDASYTNLNDGDVIEKIFRLTNGSWALVLDNTDAGEAKPGPFAFDSRVRFELETPTDRSGKGPLSFSPLGMAISAAITIVVAAVLVLVGFFVTGKARRNARRREAEDEAEDRARDLDDDDDEETARRRKRRGRDPLPVDRSDDGGDAPDVPDVPDVDG